MKSSLKPKTTHFLIYLTFACVTTCVISSDEIVGDYESRELDDNIEIDYESSYDSNGRKDFERTLDYTQNILINDQIIDCLVEANRLEFLKVRTNDDIVLECEETDDSGQEARSMRWRLNGEVIASNETNINFDPKKTNKREFQFTCEFYGFGENTTILEFPRLILGNKSIFVSIIKNKLYILLINYFQEEYIFEPSITYSNYLKQKYSNQIKIWLICTLIFAIVCLILVVISWINFFESQIFTPNYQESSLKNDFLIEI